MGTEGLGVKLRCASWEHLANLYQRDLSAGKLALRSSRPPPVGTNLRIDLVLPSGSVIVLQGEVARLGPASDGSPSVEVALARIPASALWVIESALASPAARSATGPAPAGPRAEGAAAAPAAAPASPTLGEGQETSLAEAALLEALGAELATLRSLNAFQILGVSYEADDEAVQGAFAAACKRYHPDRFAAYESDPLRAAAAEIFVVLREARRQIATAAGRAALVQAMAPARAAKAGAARVRAVGTAPGRVAVVAAPPAPAPLPPAPPGPRAALSEDDLFGDLGAEAEAAPPAPAPLDLGAGPAVEDVEALLDAGRHAEAIAACEAALRERPGDRAARARRLVAQGLAAAESGDPHGAAARLANALEIEPGNERAARELAAVRRATTDGGRGLLGRLLGRR